MYGVCYKPAAKKRGDRMSANMNAIPAISSNMDNVAALTNEPVDWKGYKTHFKFQHNQQPLNPTTTGSGEKIDSMVNGKQSIYVSNANSYNQSQECSFDNPGNFDVALFHNVLEEEVGNLTSERMKALFSEERRRSTTCNERRQQYHNVHRSKTHYSHDGATELGITNNGYVKGWIGDNARNEITDHEEQESERAQQGLEQIAKYGMNASACTCGKQYGEVNSSNNDSGSEDKCTSGSQCHRNKFSVDNAKQSISITIEDPSRPTYGNRNGRANEHGPVKKSNPARINKRGYSTEVYTREMVHQKLPRKYSMC